jgi:hypothetical protein
MKERECVCVFVCVREREAEHVPGSLDGVAEKRHGPQHAEVLAWNSTRATAARTNGNAAGHPETVEPLNLN